MLLVIREGGQQPRLPSPPSPPAPLYPGARDSPPLVPSSSFQSKHEAASTFSAGHSEMLTALNEALRGESVYLRVLLALADMSTVGQSSAFPRLAEQHTKMWKAFQKPMAMKGW